MEVSPKECFLRVHYRAVDSCFGDKYRPDDVKPNAWGDHQLQGNARGISGWMKIHPKDRKEKVIHDIEDYFLCKNVSFSLEVLFCFVFNTPLLN